MTRLAATLIALAALIVAVPATAAPEAAAPAAEDREEVAVARVVDVQGKGLRRAQVCTAEGTCVVTDRDGGFELPSTGGEVELSVVADTWSPVVIATAEGRTRCESRFRSYEANYVGCVVRL